MRQFAIALYLISSWSKVGVSKGETIIFFNFTSASITSFPSTTGSRCFYFHNFENKDTRCLFKYLVPGWSHVKLNQYPLSQAQTSFLDTVTNFWPWQKVNKYENHDLKVKYSYYFFLICLHGPEYYDHPADAQICTHIQIKTDYAFPKVFLFYCLRARQVNGIEIKMWLKEFRSCFWRWCA